MRIVNKKALRDFRILEKNEAGLELRGAEIKSIRAGRIDLNESFVRLKEGQAYLQNAHIYPFKGSDKQGLDPRRDRRLLLHKREILNWAGKSTQKGLTVVPISCIIRHNLAKLEIGLAQSKKKHEKKEILKRRDMEREVEREIKSTK